MSNIKQIASDIAKFAPSSGYLKLLQELEIGKEGWQNELVLFMKPELFMVTDPTNTCQSVELVLEKLAAFKAIVHGIAIVGGQFLSDNGIMDRHYGYINYLSKKASKVISEEDRGKIAAALGHKSISGLRLLGGHEYLQAYPKETIPHLDHYWFAKKALKIRSGFYVNQHIKGGEPLILVNGFHPSQLNHFTQADHRIVLFLVHSNTPWKTLRNDLVGNTFPEKASPDSLRGSLYANPAIYGLKKVDISMNGVHLSAGPFESVFEVLNFFGGLQARDIGQPLPLLTARLTNRGISSETALKVSKNPPVKVGEKITDLFTATEDFDTDQAIDFWLNQQP